MQSSVLFQNRRRCPSKKLLSLAVSFDAEVMGNQGSDIDSDEDPQQSTNPCVLITYQAGFPGIARGGGSLRHFTTLFAHDFDLGLCLT